MDDFGDGLLGCLGTLLLIGLALLIVGVSTDMIQDRRSFDAQAACLTRRLKPQRQTWGTKVVCIPDATRRDTTTVEVKQ